MLGGGGGMIVDGVVSEKIQKDEIVDRRRKGGLIYICFSTHHTYVLPDILDLS